MTAKAKSDGNSDDSDGNSNGDKILPPAGNPAGLPLAESCLPLITYGCRHHSLYLSVSSTPVKPTTLTAPDKVPGIISINHTTPISPPSARPQLSTPARAALDAEEQGHIAANRRWMDVSKSSQQGCEEAKQSKRLGDKSSPQFKSYVRDLPANLY